MLMRASPESTFSPGEALHPAPYNTNGVIRTLGDAGGCNLNVISIRHQGLLLGVV